MSPYMEMAYYVAGPVFIAAVLVIFLMAPPKLGRHRGERRPKLRRAHPPTHRAAAPKK